MDPSCTHPKTEAVRLPRLRGDGPLSAIARSYPVPAAPPTRGWTFVEMPSQRHVEGCPAYAGMDPIRIYTKSGRNGLPRLRGDGPLRLWLRRRRTTAAPPTRGWTHIERAHRLSAEGCPAYAGMDPWQPTPASPLMWLPRLRGDGPRAVLSVSSQSVAAPPTRGWTLIPAGPAAAATGCPAYAGMDPIRKAFYEDMLRLPRLRGDGPLTPTDAFAELRAAPPTRGWTHNRDIHAKR